MRNMLSVVIVGVGGQGSLLASRILGHLAISGEMDVKVSEVHGMSQRGGSVITHVRMDKEPVHSPLVEQGGADAILALERLEALRALPYLKDGGLMVVGSQEILPLPVITGAVEYPKDIDDRLAAHGNVRVIDALSIAEKIGVPRAANVVLMGVLSRALPFSTRDWEDAIRACVPMRFTDANLAAFEAGRAVDS
jgi:indolepyruvate ferredoxin oxidoreductase beta subunit